MRGKIASDQANRPSSSLTRRTIPIQEIGFPDDRHQSSPERSAPRNAGDVSPSRGPASAASAACRAAADRAAADRAARRTASPTRGARLCTTLGRFLRTSAGWGAPLWTATAQCSRLWRVPLRSGSLRATAGRNSLRLRHRAG